MIADFRASKATELVPQIANLCANVAEYSALAISKPCDNSDKTLRRARWAQLSTSFVFSASGQSFETGYLPT
jgi:hypothetical protein